MAAVKKGMAAELLDLQALSQALQPDPQRPDEPVTTARVVCALCQCPALMRTPTGAEAAGLEATLRALGAFADVDPDALDHAVRQRCDLLLALLWEGKVRERTRLEPAVEDAIRSMGSAATRVLNQAQMLMPQQRWVQQTLAVARCSALVSNRLWSHTDLECHERMAAALQREGQPLPRLTLHATARGRLGDEIVPGAHIVLDIRLERGHASDVAAQALAAFGSGEPPAVVRTDSPHGACEAYWIYSEGLKPEGTPNSLLAAQPLIVDDLTQEYADAHVVFTAPPEPGTYAVRVHILSTAVVGVEVQQDVQFCVTAPKARP